MRYDLVRATAARCTKRSCSRTVGEQVRLPGRADGTAFDCRGQTGPAHTKGRNPMIKTLGLLLVCSNLQRGDARGGLEWHRALHRHPVGGRRGCGRRHGAGETGEYVIAESVTFLGKAIVVRSESGPEATTIRMSETPRDPDRASVVVLRAGRPNSPCSKVSPSPAEEARSIPSRGRRAGRGWSLLRFSLRTSDRQLRDQRKQG